MIKIIKMMIRRGHNFTIPDVPDPKKPKEPEIPAKEDKTPNTEFLGIESDASEKSKKEAIGDSNSESDELPDKFGSDSEV